jgi:hypothetical protein
MTLAEIRDRNRAIPHMIRSGLTVKQIARQHRLREGYVVHLLRRAGLESWQYSRRCRDSLIRQLRKDGFAVHEIAAEFGLTGGRVSQIAGRRRRR